MSVKIENTPEIAFCFGVRRAVNLLEKAAREYGKLETLGPVVHNDQVMERLGRLGISVIRNPGEAKSGVIAISSHGVPPEIEAELRSKNVRVIDTTCPFVRRAQTAAKKLEEAGFFVIVFGDAQHSEVKGILGRTQGKGAAVADSQTLAELKNVPRRIGVLAQTTQIPENYKRFAKEVIDLFLTQDAEIRIIDTICHDICKRQAAALDLAAKTDLMVVVGGRSSANTKRLGELCAGIVETRMIETAEEINPEWLKGKKHIGVTSGTSTADQTLDEVLERLKKETEGNSAN
jgi:4-hydroxy-3-methylbut-2-enyl diphosphate reductase